MRSTTRENHGFRDRQPPDSRRQRWKCADCSDCNCAETSAMPQVAPAIQSPWPKSLQPTTGTRIRGGVANSRGTGPAYDNPVLCLCEGNRATGMLHRARIATFAEMAGQMALRHTQESAWCCHRTSRASCKAASGHLTDGQAPAGGMHAGGVIVLTSLPVPSASSRKHQCRKSGRWRCAIRHQPLRGLGSTRVDRWR
jgi:hypothetical protein